MWPLTSTWEATMSTSAPGPAQAATDVKLGAVFVSLELSRSIWLITSLSPGSGEKMSKHSVRGGDAAGLLDLLAGLRARTQARTGKTFRVIVIQEAGLDGFWVHRVLERESIESHVVDAASVLTSRRRRRAASTERPCCGRCWRTSAANRASAAWSGRQARQRRTAVGSAASARR